MVARTSSCAACQYEMEPDNPRALEFSEDDDLKVYMGDLDELPRFVILADTRGTFDKVYVKLSLLTFPQLLYN